MQSSRRRPSPAWCSYRHFIVEAVSFHTVAGLWHRPSPSSVRLTWCSQTACNRPALNWSYVGPFAQSATTIVSLPTDCVEALTCAAARWSSAACCRGVKTDSVSFAQWARTTEYCLGWRPVLRCLLWLPSASTCRCLVSAQQTIPVEFVR